MATNNQQRPTRFGRGEFALKEHQALQSTLRRQLAPEMVSQRQGPGGQRLAYIEGWRLIALANEVFGFNGWSHSVTQQTIDFIDFADEKYNVGVSATVRVELRDGAYHEDIGYGVSEGLKSKALSLEKARKEAATDGLKRALKVFGNVLGNCLNDKNYLRWVSRVNPPNPPNPDVKETVSFQLPGEIQESRYIAMEERQVQVASKVRELKQPSPREEPVVRVKEEVVTQPSVEPKPAKLLSDSTSLPQNHSESNPAKLERKRRQEQQREEFLKQLKKRKEAQPVDKERNSSNSDTSPLAPEEDDEASWLRYFDECGGAFLIEEPAATSREKNTKR